MWTVLVVSVVVALALIIYRQPQGPRLWLGLPPISLCLVVRDQADRIEGLVGDLVGLCACLGGCVADVVVADDGSTDGTGELLRRLERRYPAIKTLYWPHDTQVGGQVLEAVRALCAGRCVLLRQELRPGGGAATEAPQGGRLP